MGAFTIFAVWTCQHHCKDGLRLGLITPGLSNDVSVSQIILLYNYTVCVITYSGSGWASEDIYIAPWWVPDNIWIAPRWASNNINASRWVPGDIYIAPYWTSDNIHYTLSWAPYAWVFLQGNVAMITTFNNQIWFLFVINGSIISLPQMSAFS